MLSSKQQLALHYIENDKDKTEILYGGGAGSGKSFFGCFWQISRRLAYPGTRGLIGRSSLKALKTTTLRTFREVWTENYASNSYGITIKENNQENIIYFSNGSEIILKDLFQYPSDPDFISLGSMEITDAFIDEASEIKKKARDIVQSRIRYKLINNKPVLLMSCNPGPGFLKEEYVLSESGKEVTPKDYQIFIKALLHDNPNPEFIKTYERQLMNMPLYDRLRLLNGDWSINENDKPFIHAFNSDIHVLKENVDYFKGEPILISFDFNINPTTAVLMQKIPGKGIFILDCIQVKGGTEVLCEELEWTIYHPSGIEVTGDYSGNSGSTTAGLLPGGVYNTDFEIIKKVLRLGTFQLINTMRVNPKHEHSRRVCNYLLEKCPVYFNPKAKALIYDIQIGQATDQGKLRKDRDQFKMDAMDAWRYGVNAMFPNGLQDIVKFVENLL